MSEKITLKGTRFLFYSLLCLACFCNIKGSYDIPYVTELINSLNYDDQVPELMQILDEFVQEAANNGVDLSYIYTEPILIRLTDKFGDLPFRSEWGVNARSYGVNDPGIFIFFEAATWFRRDSLHRRIIMAHELGHSVLKLPHGTPNIMKQSLGREIHTMDQLKHQVRLMLIQAGYRVSPKPLDRVATHH